MSLAIDSIFNQVTFDGADKQYHYDLTTKIKALALDIDKNVPDCAEKTLAFRALHLAVMHTGCAITKKDKYK